MRCLQMKGLSACLLLIPCLALAETEELLTWQDCLRLARDQNPSLAAARESLAVSQFDYRAARSVLYPSVDGSAGVSHSESDTDKGTSSSDSSSIGLDAGYALYSGGANRARIDQAEASVFSAQSDLRQAQSDVSTDLKRNFARLLYSQQDVQLTAQITARRKQNVDLVELRYESGKEHKGSLLRTSATYHEAASDENRARRGLRVAQRQLATSLGRGEFDVLIAQGELSAALPTGEPDYRSLLTATPAHQRTDAELRAVEAAVRIAQSPFYPDVKARASIGRNGEDLNPEDQSWSVGLSVSFPFYAGRKYENDLAGARSAARRAIARQDQTDHETLSALESAWTDMQDAMEQRDVQREFLEAAQVRAEIARSQYASGLLSFDDWNTIEDDLISTQKAMLASERDAVLAQAQWENAQGLNLFERP